MLQKSVNLLFTVLLLASTANAKIVCTPTTALNNGWETALEDAEKKPIFTRLADVQNKRAEGADLLQVKPVHVLNPTAAARRQEVVNAAGNSTTDRRSEFKHYPTKDASDKLIDQLKRTNPPVFDEKGNLLSGIVSRDFRPKLSSSDAQKVLGDELFAKAKSGEYTTLVQYSDVLAQHEGALQKKLEASMKELAQSKGRKVSDTEIEKQAKLKIDELKKAQLAAQTNNSKKMVTFTDTASTQKFAWKVDLTPNAIDDAVSEVNQAGKNIRALSADSKAELIKFDYQTGTAADLQKVLAKHGHTADESEKLYEAVKARSMNEGVFRYRQYRDGPENASFEGIAAPGLSGSASKNDLKDSPFSEGFIWYEMKMKNTRGENVRQTAGDKPRDPLLPSMLKALHTKENFLDKKTFDKFSEDFKEQLKKNYQIHQGRGNKEVFNEERIDKELALHRELHLSGFNFEPIGRTGYTRESYNANIPAATGKPLNVQITRDTNVTELDLKTGKVLQTLPYTDVEKKWNFQYNPQSELYEHVDQTSGKVLHVMHAETKKVYPVDKDGFVGNVSVPANLTPTEVTEVKVPIDFIGLTDADIAKVPGLAPIRQLRQDLVQETQALNALRREEGLPGFAVDKGKRSTSRKSITSSEFLEVNGVKTKFEYNAESGLYVQWVNGKAAHVYHPNQGVQKITRDPKDNSNWILEDVPSKRITNLKKTPATTTTQPSNRSATQSAPELRP
jgi:hypothetical protein